jgi:hypothetical protein
MKWTVAGIEVQRPLFAEGLIAGRLRDMSEWRGELDTRSRDFH